MYLGVHNDKDISLEDYKGSGTYWNNYIKKHGYNVKTEILDSHENRDTALEIEAYQIALSGAITWNKKNFCNISPGGQGNRPGFTMKQLHGENYVDPRKGKLWNEIYKKSNRKVNKGYKYKDLNPNHTDPRQNKTWEEIYGTNEAKNKKLKQSLEKTGKVMAPYKARTGVDFKKGKKLIDIYGYSKYANPPRQFTVRFYYPDNRAEVLTFKHEQDFFNQTKLETTTLILLKKYKSKVIKKITTKTRHIYPKGTLLEIIS